jgi:L,D-transpeptidase-like protein/putative peptidoglycan binding protein
MLAVSALRRLCTAVAVLVAVVAGAGLSAPAWAEGGGDPTVLSFGAASFLGSPEGTRLAQPLVGMAASPTGGYWLASADGGVFAYGAPFHGSAGGTRLAQPIVGMAAAPGGGYWLVARDGGVFSYGGAGFFGSTGGQRLNQPVVGMAATPTGNGYWLVAADGGLFAFGDAGFFGSASPYRPQRPVTGMAVSSTGRGYWLASADGGVFAFGDAAFLGSGSGRVPPGKAVVAIAPVSVPVGGPASAGYWLLSADDVLAPGSLGPSVEAVQRRLLDLGYFVQVDSRFSEVTRQAVYALEKAAGLPRRGVLGPDERLALERGTRPPTRSTSGYVVEIDKTRQLIMAVRDGQPVWTFNTSTGNGRPYTSGGRRAMAVTPEGHFRVYSAINGLRVSELGVLWLPRYFTGGYAMHGSPSIPPFPASHGCARMSNAAIDFIWAADVMPIGTPVWVHS